MACPKRGQLDDISIRVLSSKRKRSLSAAHQVELGVTLAFISDDNNTHIADIKLTYSQCLDPTRTRLAACVAHLGRPVRVGK